MSAAADRVLWEKLAAAGVTRGEMPGRREAHTPWYVRVMLGIAGLVAAVFLLLFVGIGLHFVLDSPAAATLVGAILIGAAYAMFRRSPHGDFAPMFALAVSLAGQALVAYAVTSTGASFAGRAALVALLEACLAAAMPNYLHRLISAYAAALALAFALATIGAGFLAPALLAIAVAWLWINEARFAAAHSRVAPIAYGLTLAFIHVEASSMLGRGVLLDMQADHHFLHALAPVAEALVAVVLVAVVAALVRRAGWSLGGRPAVAALLAAAAVGAASLEAPGIAGGLAIVILGFAAGNPVLWSLGVAGLLVYVCGYYYLLDVTLMDKAIVLAATGAVLLAARHVVLKRVLAHA